ncbi:MAG: DNA-processing protein DprA [Clostridium sp.]|uniref:DNA-processing protein DprA n=1 Tax=Clostridium sp. TaxID=1506 RepID=UPI0030392B77
MDKLLKVWLMTTEISNENKKKIFSEFSSGEALKNIVFLRESDILEGKVIKKLLNSYEIINENNILEHMERSNIHVTTIYDEEYPSSLKLYKDSPFGMFYKGDITNINKSKSISIVGSRRCSRYGIDVTNSIINELSGYDINIISGMARGVDSIAHRAAIENNINTVAVLGSGIDVIYPRENIRLYNDIIESGGCILSEFPLGTEPFSRNFPMRNRIISGISDLLVVTEGGERSGTLITAGNALEQGKDIIVVPGSVFSNESKGTNKLIRDGAYVFTEIEDILNLLNISRISMNNNIETLIKSALEEKIYNLIDDNPIHIDSIIKSADIDINQLYKLLFELQAKEEILCLSGNFYVRINRIANTR